MVTDNGIVAGNFYNKYKTKNPVFRLLMNHFIEQMKTLVAKTGVSDIHETGCGEGYLSEILHDFTGKKIRGSDYSEKIIETAIALHASKDIVFKVCSIYDLDPEIDFAELIICSQTLEHLEQPHAALAVIQKLARPYAVISVPNEPLWRVLNLMRGKYVKRLGNTPGHIQHWSKSNFVRLLEEYFEICSVNTPFPWIMVLCKAKS